MFLPSRETNKHEVSKSGRWEAHSRLLLFSQTTVAANLCSAQAPSILASSWSPGKSWMGYTAGRLTSSHFLFGFKKQNTRVKWPPPELCTASRRALHKPALQLPFADKMLSRCCSQSQPRGRGADASQASGNMPKPWHLALA